MTIKAAVIGNPIAHSKSPRMHNHWLSELGIDGEYGRIKAPLDGFEDTVHALQDAGYAGANVTIPFKERAFAMADEASEIAETMGAANTLVFKDGKIIADNTDGYGFGQNILDHISDWDVAGRHIVLGAGGAARAIVAWLDMMGASEILIANRTRLRAEAIAATSPRIGVIDEAAIEGELRNATTLINTSARGMNGENDWEIDFTEAADDLIVTDIVYTPLETGLLKDAKAQGLRIVDGLGMLLWQARPGFAAWFGQDAPPIDAKLRAMMLAE